MNFERFDLRCRQTKPAEAVSAGTFQLLMIERIESRADTAPNRGGGRRGELLAADDGGEAGKARLAPSQRRHACKIQHRPEPRIEFHQRLNGLFEVGLRVEVDCH